ncbi:thiamine phosphate synthase [Rhizomonospora bruguierae]|uniref:thiamine phosphate synthase n=1 Tax=Rhizomonospora bruguierae TaxID=1581705 RepID=UPI001BCB8523|nr:thiamine phosphate synthase [Micromonospora sp. NBRC 107566]
MPALGRLHLVTDALPVVRAALSAGTPVVQVRVDDGTTDREAYGLTRRILDLCRRHGATCLVNDRVDVALAAGADGVHVGAEDLPVEVARRLLGPAAVLGATARTPAAARAAVAAGATYLGVGPAYPTSTKTGLPAPLGPAGVAAVAAAVPAVPVIAIGGVTAGRVGDLLAAGAYGVAVVGAVSAAADPGRAAVALLAALPPPSPEPAAAGAGPA